jgi:3-keto-L-gulonate-6-phosphate decarboxylase
MLPAPEFDARVSPFPLLAAEVIESVGENGARVACISAMPPRAATHAAYLCKRLKQRFPEVKVLVALWTSENTDRARARLRDAGVDHVATHLAEAIEQLRQLAVPATLELQQQRKQSLA